MFDPSIQSEDSRSYSNKFRSLLIALVLLLIIYPYLEGSALGGFLLGLYSITIVISAVYALRTYKRIFLFVIILALATIVLHVVSLIRGGFEYPFAGMLFVIFYVFTTVVIFSEVISDKKVTSDTIYGAVCIYLLIGITFGILYQIIEIINPGSFYVSTATKEGVIPWSDLNFFSFMTLTTVGYGDITPVTSRARSLTTIEGIIGILYVAVLIARLVGLSRNK